MAAFVGLATGSTRSTRTPAVCRKLVPGVPSGQDVRDNQPLRSYVPAPVETYEKRSFATVLPKTWEGEVPTVGVADAPEAVEEDWLVPETAESTSAFVEYARKMKDEREAALAAKLSEADGDLYPSNFAAIKYEGVKCFESWR
uniref:Uncharacterized protein n=1 Tax=Erythrolobus madagascarensis TaxID=708628 RepID=A0A7S0T6I9_9RHOD